MTTQRIDWNQSADLPTTTKNTGSILDAVPVLLPQPPQALPSTTTSVAILTQKEALEATRDSAVHTPSLHLLAPVSADTTQSEISEGKFVGRLETSLQRNNVSDAHRYAGDMKIKKKSPDIAAPIPPPIPPVPPLSPPTSQANSWLAAWLLRSGVDSQLVRDCEEKLVTQEGFVTEGDFAECPPDMMDHAYLKDIGISGKGVQLKIIKLHRELYAQTVSPPPLPSTPAPATVDNIFDGMCSVSPLIPPPLPSIPAPSTVDKILNGM